MTQISSSMASHTDFVISSSTQNLMVSFTKSQLRTGRSCPPSPTIANPVRTYGRRGMLLRNPNLIRAHGRQQRTAYTPNPVGVNRALQIRFAPSGTGGCYPVVVAPHVADIVHYCFLFIAQYDCPRDDTSNSIQLAGYNLRLRPKI
jgi:hypothetical protein